MERGSCQRKQARKTELHPRLQADRMNIRTWILSEINLSVASFTIIFSYSEGCLFTLLIVSFVVQKILSLVRSQLFLLLFPIFWEMGHRDLAVIYVRECFAYVFL